MVFLNIILFLCLFAIAYIIIDRIIRRRVNKVPYTEYLNSNRATGNQKKNRKVENDKLVTVNNVGYDSFRIILNYVCNLYNNEKFVVQPRLIKLSDNNFALLFPYDITFERFCYFINYLHFPHGLNFNYDPSIKGWATTRRGDMWIGAGMESKEIMIFIDQNEKEFDNIYFVTSDDMIYKCGFSAFKKKAQLVDGSRKYEKPSLNFSYLNKMQFEDFR